MSLKVDYVAKSHGVTWISGRVYIFRYSAWRNDPTPTIIFINRVTGTHPKTGHQHRYFQGINLTYVPRPARANFAKDWIRTLERSGGNTQLTWNIVKNKYPNLKHAIRRYFIKPNYYIQDIRQIPFENMEDVIISSWSKDFSKKVRMELARKFKQATDAASLLKKKFSPEKMKKWFGG